MMRAIPMAEADDIGSRRLWRFVRIGLLALVGVGLLGMVAGFVAIHIQEGGALSRAAILFLAGALFALAGCAWLLWREVNKPTGEEPLTSRERLNRNILIGCGALGGLIGLAMTLSQGRLDGRMEVFSSDPLPGGVALVLALLIGVLLPAVSIYWHRSAVDELEEEAYKTGALYAIYVYMTGAPVWWLLWRGGFVPAPDGIIIYFATIITLGVVWFRKKHG